jgi:D-glycero-alpha-D-manno-heptose-7-phosphate kinase
LSFFGGGTDLKEFYGQEGGAVMSTAIDKYIFVTVNKKFDDHIRVSYSQTEIVERVDQVQHSLVREAMKLTGVDRGSEITTVADIPSQGTGLGSSSTFTVGLLNALSSYRGVHVSAEKLATDACKIEIEILKEPIGKQDQYIAAYGGLQFIQFNQDGSVFIDPVICQQKIKDELQSNLLLFYTGMTRRANSILSEQKAKSAKEKLSELKRIKGLVVQAKTILQSGKSLDEFGQLLDEGWQLKKSLASGVTNGVIDDLYAKARQAGALGGKIAGAGGGGFLLLYVPPDKQSAVRQALNGLKETPFCFEPQGSKIVYVG